MTRGRPSRSPDSGGVPVGTPPGAEWPLTARDGILQAAVDALAGQPGSVVIAGAPGMGKTRLLRELAAPLGEAGLVVEWPGRGVDPPVTGSAALARWVGCPVPLDVGGVEDMVRRIERRATPTSDGRLVMVVDDAHLFDPIGAMVMQQLVAAGVARVALGLRSGTEGPEAITSLWKDGLARRMDLHAFSEEETTAFLEAGLSGWVDSNVAHELWTDSGGNPRELGDLLADALRHGRVVEERGIWHARADRRSPDGAGPTEASAGSPSVTEDLMARCRAELREDGPNGLVALLDVAGSDLIADERGGPHADSGVLHQTIRVLRDAVVPLSRGDVRRSHAMAVEILADASLAQGPRQCARCSMAWAAAFSGHGDVGTTWPPPGDSIDDASPALLPYVLTQLWRGAVPAALGATHRYGAAVVPADEPGSVTALMALGLCRLATGNLADARRCLEDATRRLIRSDPLSLLPLAAAELARTAASVGDEDGAGRALALAVGHPLSEGLYGPLIARSAAWVAACAGQLGHSAELSDGAVARASALGQSSIEAMILHDVVRAGRPEAAWARLSALAQELPGPIVSVYAAHAHALEGPDAAGLEAAAVQFEDIGARLLSSECWVQAAAQFQHDGQRRGERWAARSREMAASCDGARTPALLALGPKGILSTRETEILALARQGLSSPQIALRCSLSRRTVENHLYRAYEKLGVRGRSEL